MSTSASEQIEYKIPITESVDQIKNEIESYKTNLKEKLILISMLAKNLGSMPLELTMKEWNNDKEAQKYYSVEFKTKSKNSRGNLIKRIIFIPLSKNS